MKSKFSLPILTAVLLAGSAQAQYTANFQTNLISGVVSNWTGNYEVGNTTFADVLIVTNSAVLKDSSGYLGFSAGSSNNVAIITGAGSVWSNSATLYVGDLGSSNTLTIANGGAVSAAGSFIGFGTGGNTGANSNTVTVTGTGSVWNNSGSLNVGYGDLGFNTLTIANGGAVSSAGTSIIGAAANGNTVTVTGPGSVWNNSGTLDVGQNSGYSNTLTIANGGAVTVGGYLLISSALAGSNNTVNVTGGQLTVTNGAINVGANGTGTFNISGGTVLAQQLLATNAYSVININGGTLVSRSTTVSNGQNFSIGNTGGNGGSATFTALGGTHTFQHDLYIGNSSSGNQLVITNAATVYNANGYIGYGAANFNAVTVTGPGSVWNNSGNLTVGYDGNDGTLTIANGGAVSNANGAIGYASGANGNAVTVTGPGSVWKNSGALTVGYQDDGFNTLTITNLGLVIAASVSIGSDITGEFVYDTVSVNSGGELSFNGANGGIYVGESVDNAGVLTINGGSLGVFGNASFSNQQAIAGGPGTVTFVSGNLVIEPAGVVSFGPSFTVFTNLTVVNQGVLQLQASAFTFGSGFDNQAGFTMNPAQLVSVHNGFDNEGILVLNSGAALSVDRFADGNQRGSLFLYSGASFSVAAAWTNAGAIELAGGILNGSAIQNISLIEGSGGLTAPLNNLAGGTVRASGGLLALNGSSIQNQAGGDMEAESGATLRLNTGFTNLGVINNLGGLIDFGSNTLTNQGTLTGYGTFKAGTTVNDNRALFSGGNVSVYGTYLNNGASATTVVDFVTANFYGAVTIGSGSLFKNTSSQVTFFNTFQVNGSYVSDPATNVFTAMLALGPNGALHGGKGDLFVLQSDLTSANADGLQIDGATLEFTSGAHNFTLAGTASLGALQLDSGATLKFSGAALYVGEFNAALSQISTPDTIFYDPTENPSLDGQTYELSGGGLLEAVPEPDTFALVLVALACGIAVRGRRRA